MICLPEYDELISHAKRTATLASCASVLMWDQYTYMPSAGAEHRSEQLSLLAGMIHELETAPEMNEWLSACEDSDLGANPHSEAAANVRELRHRYDRCVKVPKRLVEALARATSMAHPPWVQARQSSDFSLFGSHLDQIVRLKREYADAVGFEQTRYDALLDGYEPGLNTGHVRKTFSSLRIDLIRLINQVAEAPRQPDSSILRHCFPIEKQQIFAEMIAAKVGFDFVGGRLDTAVHPFSLGIGPGDSRITARWNEQDLETGLFTVLHETGHALYEQGLPARAWGTPAGSAMWLSIHESQSRLWENFVGRGVPFWQYCFPILKALFHTALRDVDITAFVHALNEVRPSLIRVGADELTYNLHIILRFELEVAMISGELCPLDLPDAWNTMFKEMFDLQVPDDARGCLQDAHWADGDFGYFPTYTLGNIYAAQIFASIRREIPELDREISQGHFSCLTTWLRDTIHQRGSRYRASELCEEVTGEAPDHRYLITSLQEKLGALYGF